MNNIPYKNIRLWILKLKIVTILNPKEAKPR